MSATACDYTQADSGQPGFMAVCSDFRELHADEFYSWADAGGALKTFQKLMAKQTMRASLSGLTRMVEAHASVPHDGTPFVRPDGTTLSQPPEPSLPPGLPERDADR